MLSKIAEIINTHTYTVDSWLLDALEIEYEKGTYSTRKNIDALALEMTLKKVGKIKTLDKLPNERYQWRHDWAFNQDFLIDLKRRPKWSDKYCISGFKNLSESASLNQLTHIVGFTQNIENDYKVGDELTFEFQGAIPISKLLTIKYSGQYAMLSQKHLQKEKCVV